jgi:sensor histidine kinase YesM
MKKITWLPKMTLFKKNFILLFLSVSLSIIALGVLSYYSSSKQIEQISSAFLENNLQQNSERLRDFFREVQDKSDKVIGNNKLQMLLEEQLNNNYNEQYFINALFPIMEEMENPFQLTIYPVGIEAYKNYLNRIQSDGVDKETYWYNTSLQLEGTPFWQVHTLDRDSALPAGFTFIRTIRSLKSLEKLAVLTIDVPEELLSKKLIKPPQYERYSFQMIDEDNNVIYADERQHIGNVSKGQLVNNKVSGGFHINVHHVDHMLVAFSAIEDTSWSLVAMIPKADLLGPIQVIREFSMIIIVVSLVVMSIFLALITNKFTMPIRLVVQLMKKVQLGELSIIYQFVTRSDEIGQLARGYNSMVGGMRELISTTKQVEEEKRELEMKMLINQINPHFLYNTLDSIKWKADHSGNKVISEMVASLANLLRFSISGGELFASVEREMEHVKSFIKIEQMKSNYSFQVIVQIHPSISHMPILRLTLQPIVENAIKHGTNRLQDGIGKIVIQMFRQDDLLLCVVEDNGPGASKPIRLDRIHDVIPAGEGGLGLYNVNRRMNIQYGERYGITAGNISISGFRVVLKYPVH